MFWVMRAYRGEREVFGDVQELLQSGPVLDFVKIDPLDHVRSELIQAPGKAACRLLHFLDLGAGLHLGQVFFGQFGLEGLRLAICGQSGCLGAVGLSRVVEAESEEL